MLQIFPAWQKDWSGRSESFFRHRWQDEIRSRAGSKSWTHVAPGSRLCAVFVGRSQTLRHRDAAFSSSEAGRTARRPSAWLPIEERFFAVSIRLRVVTFVFCPVWVARGAGRRRRYCGRPLVDVYLGVRSNRPAGCGADGALRPGRPLAGEGVIRQTGEKAALGNSGGLRVPIGRQIRSRRLTLRNGQQARNRNSPMGLAIFVHPVRSSDLARKTHCL